MVKNLPDKWIRKAIFDVVNGVKVDGVTLYCFDSRVSGKQPNNYVLLSTQSNEVNKDNKCAYKWESSILIEIYTRYSITTNTGSRLLADNITDEIRNLTNNLTLDIGSNLDIIWQRQSFQNDLVNRNRQRDNLQKIYKNRILID